MSKYLLIVVSFVSLLCVNCLGEGDPQEASGSTGGSNTGGSSGAGSSSGSGGASASGGSGGACVSGKVDECACPGGAKGTQTCKSDGSGFGSCDCPDSGTPSDGGKTACEPGKDYECACPGGAKGTQTCAADGQSLGKCGCDSGTGGSGGSGGASAGTKNVTFEYTLPEFVESLTGVTLFGMTYDPVLKTYSGWTSWCDSITSTASQVMVQNGLTFTCTRALPVGNTAFVNVLVQASGTSVFQSGGNKIDACWGEGLNCQDASCWKQYGTLKVNGEVISLAGGDGVDNKPKSGCNFAFTY